MKTNLMRATFAFVALAFTTTVAFATVTPSSSTPIVLEHDPAGIVATARTDADGNANFRDLKPGKYAVVIKGADLVAAINRFASPASKNCRDTDHRAKQSDRTGGSDKPGIKDETGRENFSRVRGDTASTRGPASFCFSGSGTVAEAKSINDNLDVTLEYRRGHPGERTMTKSFPCCRTDQSLRMEFEVGYDFHERASDDISVSLRWRH